MYTINEGKVQCHKEESHTFPSVMLTNNPILVDGVELFQDFRLVCDKKDVVSYNLVASDKLEKSKIMNQIEDVEKTANSLQGRVSDDFLQVLTRTESMFTLDFRYGIAIGIRRLLEDFVIENYGVLTFFPHYRFHTKFGYADLKSLKDKHAGQILAALSPAAKKMRWEIGNFYSSNVGKALSSNPQFRPALLPDSEIDNLFLMYNNLSEYLHGNSGEPSSDELMDNLTSLLKACETFINKNMGWGIL